MEKCRICGCEPTVKVEFGSNDEIYGFTADSETYFYEKHWDERFTTELFGGGKNTGL